MSNTDYIIDRLLYPCDGKVELDNNGLRLYSNDTRKYTSLINLDEFAQLPGGILLAEGGMGKSALMKQLKNSIPDGQAYLIELAKYKGDSNGLREDIKAYLSTPNQSSDSSIAIIIDGLDEAPELHGPLSRIIDGFPENVSIWIASRDIPAIRTIQSENPELKLYTLAPFSEEDVVKFANQKRILNQNILTVYQYIFTLKMECLI